MQELFFRFTFESFGQIGFGVEFGALTSSEPVAFASAFDGLQNLIAKRFANPFYRVAEAFNIFRSGVNKPQQDIEYIQKVAYQIINERRNDPHAETKSDLLSLFMRTENENDVLPSDEEIKDVVLNFIIAGRDTTAQALSWTFYCLAMHPHVLQRLYEEVKNLNEDLSHQHMFEQVRNLTYAHAVWNEVLRLYPSVPTNIKTAVQDTTFPDGTKVYAGEQVLWSPWAMGRLESIWGPTAKKFDPERWLHKDFQKPTPFKWPAFHAGPRTCLGQALATLEGVTCIALLVKRFKFELVDEKSDCKYLLSVTLPMRDPLWMNVIRR